MSRSFEIYYKLLYKDFLFNAKREFRTVRPIATYGNITFLDVQKQSHTLYHYSFKIMNLELFLFSIAPQRKRNETEIIYCHIFLSTLLVTDAPAHTHLHGRSIILRCRFTRHFVINKFNGIFVFNLLCGGPCKDSDDNGPKGGNNEFSKCGSCNNKKKKLQIIRHSYSVDL